MYLVEAAGRECSQPKFAHSEYNERRGKTAQLSAPQKMEIMQMWQHRNPLYLAGYLVLHSCVGSEVALMHL